MVHLRGQAIMSFDVEEFVRYQIANAQVRPYPFPHFCVSPVFPEDYYRELQAQLPPTEALKPIHEHGTVGIANKETGEVTRSYEPRFIAELATLEDDEKSSDRGRFWRELSSWLLGDAFRDLMIEKFRVGIGHRFGEQAHLQTDVEGRFVRDFQQYVIHPHTDQPAKLVSLLFYLPADDSLRRHGTAFYRPIDPNFRCRGTTRHPFEAFRKVAAMSFLPNTLVGFLKTDFSFHGVEEIKEERIERNVLLYNIYVRKVMLPKRRQAVRAIWPWAGRSRGA